MTELSSLQIRFNAPLILGFALVSLAALVLDRLTRGAANRRLFSVYRCRRGREVSPTLLLLIYC